MEPPQRPHVHLTPPSGWMNDPNGLVVAGGRWHAFYQHHPQSTDWGPMHWGHASTSDLRTWTHHPVALHPDALGTVFSGSAVEDRDGVAGYGRGALLAFFTHFLQDVPQTQGLAVSTDGGLTWRAHPGNPVVRPPEGVVDFRDPKVVRYDAPGEPGHWLMVVAAGDEVAFLTSTDLLAWHPSGSFGRGIGAHGGVWETPDLLRLPVEGGGRRWVLMVSVADGAPAGGSGTQYVVGDLDGRCFAPDPADRRPVRWADLGADFYAPQSWSGVEDGRTVLMAWMSNWTYARTVPAAAWRGAMTVPREVWLRETAAGPVLVQRPVAEVLAGAPVVATCDPAPRGAWAPALPGPVFAVRLRATGEAPWEVTTLGGAHRVSWLPEGRLLVVTRDPGGLEGADPSPRVVEVPDGDLDMVMVVDTCSVEVFADGGAAVLTDLVLPGADSRPLVVRSEGRASVEVRDLSGAGDPPGGLSRRRGA